MVQIRLRDGQIELEIFSAKSQVAKVNENSHSSSTLLREQNQLNNQIALRIRRLTEGDRFLVGSVKPVSTI
jgi:hypothetical protein